MNAEQAALALAEEYGLPVFPCRPAEELVSGKVYKAKTPYTPHGFKDASCNIEQIGEWWRRWPDALIGVPTGRATKLLVVDVDPVGLEWYRANAVRLAPGRTHKTPRGFHLLYRMPDVDIRNSAGTLAPGVDVRAEGGYIIWWPAHGHEVIGDLADLALPALPAPDARNTSQGNGHDVEGIREGGRNDFLSREGYRLRKKGSTVEQILIVLRAINEANCVPPLDEAEVRQIAEGKAQVPPEEKRPRRLPMDWRACKGSTPPPREWWVQDWLTPAPTLCSGAGGSGKSLLWQTLGTALTCGREFIGAPTKPLRVLMWACEDDRNEIWRRQAAICEHFGIEIETLHDILTLVPREGCDNTLLDLTYGKPMLTPEYLLLCEEVNDIKADVLILDNNAHTFGGNESDRHQVTMFVNRINGMVRGRSFAPVFLGHTSRAAGSEYSGSAAWENACRMRLYMGPTLPDQEPDEDGAPDDDTMYLARRKVNYTDKDWRRLKFERGLWVPEEYAGRRFDSAHRGEIAEAVVLKAMPKLLAAGVKPTDGKTAGDFLPRQIAEKGYAEGHTRKELTTAMHRLMGAGKLRRVEVGMYSNRSPRMGLVVV